MVKNLLVLIFLGLFAFSCVNKDEALIKAAEDGHLDQVKLLLAKGADANVENKEGKTALSYAEEFRFTEIVNLLKAHGAKE